LGRLLILIVFLIAYGSLYPWRVDTGAGDSNPVQVMLGGWDGRITRWVLRDALLNVALYAPLGACAWLAFRTFLSPVLLGVGLSAAVEIAQVYIAGRHSSVLDIVTNGSGAAAGMILAITFSDVVALLQESPRARKRAGDPSALALLACGMAYLLFPFVPEISPGWVQRKLQAFTASHGYAVVSSGIAMIQTWFAGGVLLRAAGVRHPGLLLLLSASIIPLQMFLYRRVPTVFDFVGALLGLSLFVAWRRYGGITYIPAVVMLALLVVRGIAPFDFGPSTVPFSLRPFAGFLEADWQRTSLVLVEKIFFYGAAIWTLRFAGMRLWAATGSVAALLTLIELAQIRLPGRTPEITDPILALMIAIGLDAFQPQRPNSPSRPGLLRERG
jgi:VanZ family protein